MRTITKHEILTSVPEPVWDSLTDADLEILGEDVAEIIEKHIEAAKAEIRELRQNVAVTVL